MKKVFKAIALGGISLAVSSPALAQVSFWTIQGNAQEAVQDHHNRLE
jgi:hypothetical protein